MPRRRPPGWAPARPGLSIAGTEDRIKELDLSAQQAAQARKRLKDSDEAVDLRIAAAYRWLLVPVQPRSDRPVALDELPTDGARERMAERASDKLRQNDRLRDVQGARNIRLDLDQHLSSVWQRGHVRVGDLWEYYCRYPYLPRLRDRSVLDNGIVGVFGELTWDTEGFAVAAGYEEEAGRYVGLALPHQDAPPQITDATLLVAPERAQDQRQRELAEREAARSGDGAAGGDTVPAGTGSVPGGGQVPAGAAPGTAGTSIGVGASGGPSAGPKNVRFFGVASVNPERYARDLTRLAQEIIQHLAAPEGVDLEIRVEIEAHKPDGYTDDKARIVTENARTLKFETYGFEDE